MSGERDREQAKIQAREPQALAAVMAAWGRYSETEDASTVDLPLGDRMLIFADHYAASLRERNAQLERRDLTNSALLEDYRSEYVHRIDELERECEGLRSERYKGIFVGQVFDCPALSVAEEGCICKSGWGHKSFAVLPNSLSDIIKAEAALRGAQKGAIHPHCMGTKFPEKKK